MSSPTVIPASASARCDGCACLWQHYLRDAREMVRWLVPVLEHRSRRPRIRRAAAALGSVRTAVRDPDLVVEAGRLLRANPMDVHAVYLGARLVVVGEHLRQRRATTAADLETLRDASSLACGLAFGWIPNDPAHLIPAGQRLDRLRAATAAVADERRAVAALDLRYGAGAVGLIREVVRQETSRPLQPSVLLQRSDQERIEQSANTMVAGHLWIEAEQWVRALVGGQLWVGLEPEAAPSPDMQGTSTGGLTDAPLRELVAAAWLVRCEAPAWHPADQRKALSLLQQTHAVLRNLSSNPSTTRTVAANSRASQAGIRRPSTLRHL